MKPVGQLKLVKKDIVDALKSDSTLSKDKFYTSMFEVDTNTKKPCHSIDLDEETEEETYTGGCIDKYTVEGMIITYLEPEIRKGTISDELDLYRERIRNTLKEADKKDTFAVISSFKYKTSYPLPWTVSSPNGPKLVAHRMIIKFTVEYGVKDV